MQQTVHPDRFLRECDRSQRLAQEQAALVNEAYQTLKTPLKRAQYLLMLAGQQSPQEQTTQDVSFLMEQMVLRERLDESSTDIVALDQLLADIRNTLDDYQVLFSKAWLEKDWPLAKQLVVKLQFASKLAFEIDERQARLLDV